MEESGFLKLIIKMKKGEESYINQKLADKVPQKLQGTLDKAFYGAFALIFEKGTTVIEKTYNKEEIENTYKVNEFADNISQNRKTLRAFSNALFSSDKYLKKVLTPTLRNSLEYTYREEGKANDDSK